MTIHIVSFLVSGRGSNFSIVAEKILKGDINAKIGVVISDRKDTLALSKARENNLECAFLDPKKFKTRKEHEQEITKLLKKAGTTLVVTAGYMRLLSPFIIGKYPNKIINIHPALLPAFPGIHAQKQALDYGVKISGCTAHFVDEGTDTGPIILQKEVTLLPDETEITLSKKILKQEHIILPGAVKLFCENKIRVKGRKVIIK